MPLLAVSAIAYHSFTGLSDLFGTYEQRVGVVHLVQDLSRDFIGLRWHVREYSLSGAAADAAAASASVTLLSNDIAAGLAGIHDPDRHARMERIATLFGHYKQGVEHTIDLRTRQDDVVHGVMDPNGAAAAKAFADLAAAMARGGQTDLAAPAREGLQHLMEMRLAANKMVGRNDEPDALDADRALDLLLGVLARLEQGAAAGPQHDVLADLRRHVGAYADGYREAHRLLRALRDLVNGDMRHDAEALAAEVGAVVDSAQAEEALIDREARAASARAVSVLLGIGAGGLVVGCAMSVLIGGAIARPVTGMATAMRGLARGELDVAIPAQGRGDEIGAMAQAMLVFRDNAVAERRLQGAIAEVQAAKDRRQEAMDRHVQEFGTSVSGVMAGLVRSAGVMRDSARSAMDAAGLMRGSATTTAAGAAESSVSLSEVAAGMEGMARAIADLSVRVTTSADDAGHAARQAAATNRTVEALAEAAERIGSVVELISQIAAQTNLLALNATIEAARAGDAGKGFAVVAGEVKALARQTTEATSVIIREIDAIRGATGQAVAAVQHVTASVGRLSERATDIASAIEAQGTTTRAIAGSVVTVTTTTRRANDEMQIVSSNATQVEEASRDVHRESELVGTITHKLHHELRHFLHAVGSSTEQDLRRYERVTCAGVTVTARAAGLPPRAVPLLNISRGGASFQLGWQAEAGTDINLELPGGCGTLPARVVRCANGMVAVAFAQNPEALETIDQFLDQLARSRAA